MVKTHYLGGFTTTDNVRVVSKVEPKIRKTFNRWANQVHNSVKRSRGHG